MKQRMTKHPTIRSLPQFLCFFCVGGKSSLARGIGQTELAVGNRLPILKRLINRVLLDFGSKNHPSCIEKQRHLHPGSHGLRLRLIATSLSVKGAYKGLAQNGITLVSEMKLVVKLISE
jgi:hypothetical protein